MNRLIGVIRTPEGWTPVLYIRDHNRNQRILELGDSSKGRQLAMAHAIQWSERTLIHIDFPEEICYVTTHCKHPITTFQDNANETRCTQCKKLWFF